MCGSGRPRASLASTGEALAALRGALAYLASVDATGLTAGEQAECLRGLERAESVRIAARSSVLSAFSAVGGYEDDGHGGVRSWLRWQARMTGAATTWMRRLAAHPAVREALACGQVSPSWAREICDWSDLLPQSARGDADLILLAAAAGADLADLAGLAEEMRKRTAAPGQDDDDGLSDRSLRLDLHFRGAGPRPAVSGGTWRLAARRESAPRFVPRPAGARDAFDAGAGAIPCQRSARACRAEPAYCQAFP